MKLDENEDFGKARELLRRYLQAKGLRRSTERFAILRLICSQEGDFSVETLYEALQKTRYRVSKATVYNTIDLLLECGLIVRSLLTRGVSQYRFAAESRGTSQLVYIETGKVEPVVVPEIDEVIKRLEEQYDIKIISRSVIFYATDKNPKKDYLDSL